MHVLKSSDFVCLLVPLLFHSIVCQGQLNGDETCNKYLTNHICRVWKECPSVTELISTRRAILCGFENSVAKLCCPLPPTTTQRVTNTPKTTTPMVTKLKNPVAIAEQKCREYARFQYVNYTISGQLLSDPDINRMVLDCVAAELLIVGGIKAEPKEFPHMALIGYGNSYSSVQWACGGSLISERFVMSAGHCGNTVLGEARWVRLGDLDISTNTDLARPKVYRIVRRFDHPNYKSPAVYNDITLFQLNTTVQFSPYVRPICLYTSQTIPTAERKFSVTGWGLTGTIEYRSDHLLKTTLNYEADNKCATSYATETRMNRGYDARSMICAGDTVYGNDTCSGDSGGPLQIPIRSETCMWTQVGITSIGPSICGDMETPAIYTKVANYISWIQPIVWP